MNKPQKISQEEWQNRVNLAAAYHLAHHFGWSDRLFWGSDVLVRPIFYDIE